MRSALEAVDGVAEVRLDFSSETATLRLEAGAAAPDEEIRKAFREQGFTARPADPPR